MQARTVQIRVRPDDVWTVVERRRKNRRTSSSRIDVWDLLAERADVDSFAPKLAPDVEIKVFPSRAGGYAMIKNPRDLIYLRLSLADAELARSMDGTRTVHDLVVARMAEGGMDADGVVGVVLDLQEGGFLEGGFIDTYAAVKRAMLPGSSKRRKARTFLRTLTVEWEGERLFRRMYDGGAKHLLRPGALITGGAIALAGIVAFGLLVASGRFRLGGDSPVLEGIVVLALNYLLVFVHEAGHALVLVHYGRRIKSMGFQIYFGRPAMFIESSDVLMLDRGKRIVQSAAGAYAELVIAGTASIVATLADGTLASTLYRFAALNYFVVFLNLVPLLELDGYYILSDVIGVPDLRPRSLAFVRSELWRKLRAKVRLTRAEIGLALYGIVGVAFTVLTFYWSYYFWEHIFGGLVKALWHAGAVGRIVLAVLVLIVAAPLVRGAGKLSKALARRVRAVVRAVRFRLERGWRVEAAELIDQLPLFEDLDEDVLGDLAGRVRRHRVEPGEEVVRQGDRGSSFYVVRRGILDVIVADVEGNERIVRGLGVGDSFGELAMLDAAPRAATVRARAPSELFEVDKGTFERILADAVASESVRSTMQDIAELRSIPVFSHLEPDALAELLRHGDWEFVMPGARLVKQGERGDAFYAIRSGQAEVVKGRHVIGTLGPGDHFGELSLLKRQPRAATVRALTAVRAFRLDREGFDRVLRSAFRRGRVRATLVGTDGRSARGLLAL